MSDGAFAMFVDDLTFNDLSVPAWELTGYEVLRDGELIATVEEPSYTDAEAVQNRLIPSVPFMARTEPAPRVSLPCTRQPLSTCLMPGAAVEAIYTPAGLRVDGTPKLRGIYLVRYTDGSVRKVVL